MTRDFEVECGPVESPTDEVTNDRPDGPPSHLFRFPKGEWGIWRWFGLRGAGFPAGEVYRLAASESAAAADLVLAAEDAQEECRRAAIDLLSRDLYDQESKTRFRRFRALSRLNRGRAPRARDSTDPATQAYVEAGEEVERLRRELHEAFERDLVLLAGRLREVASDDRFRRAVVWQNRGAIVSGLDVLVGSPADGSRNSAERRIEQLVASYLYRYSTKNDTIGWFGPIGWGRLRDSGPTIRAEPGGTLVGRSVLRFETWCVDEVTDALLGDDALRPWWRPRAWPFFLLQRDLYIPASGPPARLARQELAILRAADGRRTATELAAELAAAPDTGFAEAAAVLGKLEEMTASGLVLWRPELPMVRRPERILAELVEGIDRPDLREPRVARLAEMEAHREAIAKAGDADALARSLEALDAWFSDLTGREPTRLAGRMYAGRTLIHEDCLRDLHLEIGPGVLEELGPPLELVLESARWFTHELARRWTMDLSRAYEVLSGSLGGGPVPLFQFARAVQPFLLGDDDSSVRKVAAALQQVWVRALALPDGERRVERTSAELRDRLVAELDAPGPGWIHARIHSPDVMIAAESVEAIRAGDFQLVLGEVHVATNTLRARLVCEVHPERSELQEAVSWDIPEPTVVPWMPRERETGAGDGAGRGVMIDLPTTSARLDLDLLTRKDLRLAVNLEPPGDPEAETVRLGDFVVLEDDGELRARSMDGRHDLALMNFLAMAFTVRAVDSFRFLPETEHTPRVTIDRLVVQRESWRLAAGDLELTEAATESERFLAARRLARRHEMPRRVFVLSPYETKPFCVDFDSPPAVEILCRAVRGAIERGGPEVRLRFSEMLPDLEECWLPDAEGSRFTSEIRMVAVDLAPGGANRDHPGIRSLRRHRSGAGLAGDPDGTRFRKAGS